MKATKHQEQVYAGPRPVVTVLLLIVCILILGAVFAALKVFVIDRLEPAGTAQENGTIDVLFCPQEDCQGALLQALAGANTSACAFYELNLPAVRQELARRNTTVLVDEDNAGSVRDVRVDSVPSRGLMHHKFCVLGSDTVVTGSMNPTVNDATLNNNNLLIIRSRTLASRYSGELSELQSRQDREYTKRRARPATVNVSGTVIEQRFCPQEDCESAVVRELGGAKQEVAFMTFSFTSDPIGDAMIAARERGAVVHGVFERRQVDEWTEYERLRDEGFDVRLDGNRRTMHHKVIIIDNRTVITGSFNPTANANERNDENLLIIRDPRIAQEYAQEFSKVMGEALQFDS